MEVYNRVGLSHTVHSKGVFITDRSPMVIQAPYIDVTWAGSLVNGTQYTGRLIRTDWSFRDTYTSVNQYFWTFQTGPGFYTPLAPSHTFNTLSSAHTNINIQDGTLLSVRVIGCNQVGICVSSTSNSSILIDGSPPIDGYFALHSSFSVSLSWSIDDGMVWRNGDTYALLNITFAGFSDPHSGVSEYWAVIGSKYGQRDLFESILTNVHKHPDNNLVSMAIIQLSRPLLINETIFVWLWALNGVGRESSIVQGSFIVSGSESDGTLELLRSQHCPIVSCAGHCTCNERGHFCQLPVNNSCQQIDSSFLSSDMKVNVVSLLSQQESYSVPPFIASNNKLSGVISQMGLMSDFQWVEWSVGEINRAAGTGVIDVSSDPVWFPLGLGTGKVIFDTTPSLPLVQGKTYTIRARVWYNSTHYSTFASQGALVDAMNPQISQGFRVREVSSINSLDIDYSINTDYIQLQWDGVFNTMLSGAYLNFEIGLGESPGADNIYKLTSIGTNVTEYNLTSLYLKGNRKYYAIVGGTTPTGITAISLSDGFIVDLTPPKIGAVFIGGRYHSNSAQSNTTSVALRLLGFHDPESFIADFRVGISKLSDSTVNYFDMGMNMAPVINGLSLEDGEAYLIELEAYNSVGNVAIATSETLMIDNTQSAPGERNCTNTIREDFDYKKRWKSGNATYDLTYNNWDIDSRVNYVVGNGGGRAVQIPVSVSRNVTVDESSILQVSFDILTSDDRLFDVCFNCRQQTCDIDNDCCIKSPHIDVTNAWEEVTFTYRVTNSSIVKIDICSGERNMVIDNVVFQRCNITVSSRRYLFVEPPFSSYSPLSLTTYIIDTDSIQNKEYSIGTTLGGGQLIPFTPIAPEQSTIYPNCTYDYIEHNTSLYLSMAVTDFAGNSIVLHSEAILVDRTPPLVIGEGVKEIVIEGGDDVDYIGSSTLWIDWSNIIDEESGIKHCQWSIGKF